MCGVWGRRALLRHAEALSDDHPCEPFPGRTVPGSCDMLSDDVGSSCLSTRVSADSIDLAWVTARTWTSGAVDGAD